MLRSQGPEDNASELPIPQSPQHFTQDAHYRVLGGFLFPSSLLLTLPLILLRIRTGYYFEWCESVLENAVEE